MESYSVDLIKIIGFGLSIVSLIFSVCATAAAVMSQNVLIELSIKFEPNRFILTDSIISIQKPGIRDSDITIVTVSDGHKIETIDNIEDIRKKIIEAKILSLISLVSALFKRLRFQ